MGRKPWYVVARFDLVARQLDIGREKYNYKVLQSFNKQITIK